MSEKNTPIKRPDIAQLLRDRRQERLLDIEDISLYAYYDDDSSYLYIIGEVFAQKIRSAFYLTCTLYDADHDIIVSAENLTYGSGLVTNVIQPEAFFNGFPFEICISVPETPVARIEIIPQGC